MIPPRVTASSEPIYAGGAFDRRERPFTGDTRTGFLGSKPPYLPLRARPDVVVFQSAPLPEDVKVAGPIRVELYASSSAPDTDFTAKLIDVYPPTADFPRGFERNLTDGIVRARYRGGRHEQELLVPGLVYPSRSSRSPRRTCSSEGIGSGSTSRAAISRGST